MVFPQVNLATFIDKAPYSKFRNELFRNVDFLVTDSEYAPKIAIEINDRSHLTNERKERDKKVKAICEEAGIPILNLWTAYGINPDYIKSSINEILSKPYFERVHHFNKTNDAPQCDTVPNKTQQGGSKKRSGGCYVATCVYGSYDCPPVWTLRRYRDSVLSSTWYGRAFIRVYYATSPTLVKWFGQCKGFRSVCKSILDRMVSSLQSKGMEDTPYED